MSQRSLLGAEVQLLQRVVVRSWGSGTRIKTRWSLHHLTPPLWLLGSGCGEALPFTPAPRPRSCPGCLPIPQILLPASLSGLQQREACSLLRGVHKEIVDVAFPRGAKAQDIFLIASLPICQQKALHMGCRVPAWLALAVIRAWNQWWVADALPSVSQFLIQQEEFP